MTFKQALSVSHSRWVYRYVSPDLTIYRHENGKAFQTDRYKGLVPATRLFRDGWKAVASESDALEQLNGLLTQKELPFMEPRLVPLLNLAEQHMQSILHYSAKLPHCQYNTPALVEILDRLGDHVKNLRDML